MVFIQNTEVKKKKRKMAIPRTNSKRVIPQTSLSAEDQLEKMVSVSAGCMFIEMETRNG